MLLIFFSVQSKGIEKITWVFGPIMFLWFASLAFFGISSMFYMPGIIKAINP
ncbi:MAG: KUP/HAK/KT family potassium transporter [Methanosarcina flavescens]|uniref:KUP/HAK/KT family potassium transporter n=1 Tax=Methanosarcina flavescens TaxID=1715806 RepID=UPI000A7827A0|nr:KUP/HAK/KT family potassium transporter [Methanosarcina flavescens]